RNKIAPCKDVREFEDNLMRFIPKEYLIDDHHRLILHGRYKCKALKPQCIKCFINDFFEYPAKI
ncbi:endonuclease III, partial [Neisseria sp. P0015.S002]